MDFTEMCHTSEKRKKTVQNYSKKLEKRICYQQLSVRSSVAETRLLGSGFAPAPGFRLRLSAPALYVLYCMKKKKTSFASKPLLRAVKSKNYESKYICSQVFNYLLKKI